MRIRRLLLLLLLIPLSACRPQASLTPSSVTPSATVAVTRRDTRTSTPTVLPSATPSLSTRVTFYDVSGNTQDELRTQLDILGPVGYDGYKGDATTHWYIRWNWPGYGTNQCDLTKATISLETNVIFPRWNPPEDAPEVLLSKWTTYVAALQAHEQGHVDHVSSNYHLVLDAIRDATCQTADAAANTALVPLRQYDIDYDMATDHGRSDGARFP